LKLFKKYTSPNQKRKDFIALVTDGIS